MRRLWWLPLLPLGAWLWLVTASLTYCALTNRMALWRFPYTQWWTVLAGWSANWLMPILIVASGVIACLPFILGGLLWWRHRQPKGGRPLYGNAGLATPDHMQRHGFSLKRR